MPVPVPVPVPVSVSVSVSEEDRLKTEMQKKRESIFSIYSSLSMPDNAGDLTKSSPTDLFDQKPDNSDQNHDACHVQ